MTNRPKAAIFAGMEFTDYMLWKLGGLCLLAFLLGCFNLLPEEEQSEKQEREDS